MTITKKLNKLRNLLDTDEVRGKIIKDAAFFELSMSVNIAMYFSADERTVDFMYHIGEKLSFNDKITILTKIKYKKKYKSLECFITIKKVQRLRNVLAHGPIIFNFKKICRDTNLVDWLKDYPVTYDKDVTKAQMQLRRLANTKEFLEYQNGT